MELVEVEITGMAMTSRYGTLTSGTILRTDAAFAKHLVEDCGAAKYRDKPKGKQSDTGEKRPTKKQIKEMTETLQAEIESLEGKLAEAPEADQPALQAALDEKKAALAALA